MGLARLMGLGFTLEPLMFIRSLDTAKLHPSRPISLLFLPLNTNLTLAIKHQTETQKILTGILGITSEKFYT